MVYLLVLFIGDTCPKGIQIGAHIADIPCHSVRGIYKRPVGSFQPIHAVFQCVSGQDVIQGTVCLFRLAALLVQHFPGQIRQTLHAPIEILVSAPIGLIRRQVHILEIVVIACFPEFLPAGLRIVVCGGVFAQHDQRDNLFVVISGRLGAVQPHELPQPAFHVDCRRLLSLWDVLIKRILAKQRLRRIPELLTPLDVLFHDLHHDVPALLGVLVALRHLRPGQRVPVGSSPPPCRILDRRQDLIQRHLKLPSGGVRLHHSLLFLSHISHHHRCRSVLFVFTQDLSRRIV